MSRTFGCLAALLAFASVAGAQQRKPGDPVVLTLHPAALPASKYRLLPEGRDLVPGNAAAVYYRSLAVFADNPALQGELQAAQWGTWLQLPLGELPRKEVAARLEEMRPLLRGVDEAARRRECDWRLADRPEGFALLLPEVQGLREVARVLAVRARYHLAAGEYAEAVQALQAGYALGRHLGQGSPLIHVLVGAAITNVMDAVLEELLVRPGAPNLYWALTVLPRPYFTLDAAIEQEETMLERTWPDLKQLEDGPMTPKQVHELRQGFTRLFRRFGYVEPGALELLTQSWQQTRTYPEARRTLLAEGLPAEQLDAMPCFQLVTLYCLRAYRRALDDYTRWVRVPDLGREPGFEKDRERLRQAGERLQRLVLYPRSLPTGQSFLDPIRFESFRQAAGRTDRRFAVLQCVEALRLYAADHDGRLPPSLQDVSEVPLPVDPVTGKPFAYELHGDRAKLSSPLRQGETRQPYFDLVYELTMGP